MQKEIKISLPLYKIAYAGCFTVILGLIRGITFSSEIGIASEAPMAILAAVFCADTYTQEITSHRSEIWRLYSAKRKIRSVLGRLAVSEIFLFFLAVTGYGLFYLFQHPRTLNGMQESVGAEIKQFAVYLGAATVTLVFWGVLANTISSLFRSMWVGMGASLGIWLVTNSSTGDKWFGAWNLFSYTFRDLENSGDYSWIYGKLLCMFLTFCMLAFLPGLLKRRG